MKEEDFVLQQFQDIHRVDILIERELKQVCVSCEAPKESSVKCLHCRYRFCGKCILPHLSRHHGPML